MGPVCQAHRVTAFARLNRDVAETRGSDGLGVEELRENSTSCPGNTFSLSVVPHGVC